MEKGKNTYKFPASMSVSEGFVYFKKWLQFLMDMPSSHHVTVP